MEDVIKKEARISVKLVGNPTIYYVSEFIHTKSTMRIRFNDDERSSYVFLTDGFSENYTLTDHAFNNCLFKLSTDSRVEFVNIMQCTNESTGRKKVLYKRVAYRSPYTAIEEEMVHPYVFKNGKHKGESIIDIYQNDPSYLDWFINNSVGRETKEYSNGYTYITKQIQYLYSRMVVYDKRTDILFADEKTKTQKRKELEEHVRSIIRKASNKVMKKDLEFLYKEIFIYHPRFCDKIGDFKNIKTVTVAPDQKSGENLCFYLHYKNGKVDDISWVSCINNRFLNYYETI